MDEDGEEGAFSPEEVQAIINNVQPPDQGPGEVLGQSKGGKGGRVAGWSAGWVVGWGDAARS